MGCGASSASQVKPLTITVVPVAESCGPSSASCAAWKAAPSDMKRKDSVGTISAVSTEEGLSYTSGSLGGIADLVDDEKQSRFGGSEPLGGSELLEQPIEKQTAPEVVSASTADAATVALETLLVDQPQLPSPRPPHVLLAVEHLLLDDSCDVVNSEVEHSSASWSIPKAASTSRDLDAASVPQKTVASASESAETHVGSSALDVAASAPEKIDALEEHAMQEACIEEENACDQSHACDAPKQASPPDPVDAPLRGSPLTVAQLNRVHEVFEIGDSSMLRSLVFVDFVNFETGKPITAEEAMSQIGAARKCGLFQGLDGLDARDFLKAMSRSSGVPGLGCRTGGEVTEDNVG